MIQKIDQKNFKDILSKKIDRDYQNDKLDVEADFKNVSSAIDKSQIFIEFTEELVNDSTKKAILHLEIPIQFSSPLTKYKDTILIYAKDLFGTRDGFYLDSIQIDKLEIPKFAIDRLP